MVRCSAFCCPFELSRILGDSTFIIPNLLDGRQVISKYSINSIFFIIWIHVSPVERHSELDGVSLSLLVFSQVRGRRLLIVWIIMYMCDDGCLTLHGVGQF